MSRSQSASAHWISSVLGIHAGTPARRIKLPGGATHAHGHGVSIDGFPTDGFSTQGPHSIGVRVHGIDFSGSAAPGEDIWLVSGEVDGDGGNLRVTDARPASVAFGVDDRGPVLAGLREFLAGEAPARGPAQVAGVDCSFGLPRAVLPDAVAEYDDWRQTLDWVVERFADADGRSFQSALKERARASDVDGVELKRATDGPTGASSPYSFITRYQTLHGMRDVLGPLVRDERVAVPPMLPADRPLDDESRGSTDGVPDRPAVIEVYPAATLRALDLPDRRYKDDANFPDAPTRRKRILDGLLEWGVRLEGVPRERLLADSGGDALDALVAAVGVARAMATDLAVDPERYEPVEGYIYV